MRAGAVRTQVFRAVVAASAQRLRELPERAGRRVLLRRMVNFPTPGFVFGLSRNQTGSMRNDLNEKIYAYGKIRRPNERGAVLFHNRSNRGQVVEPAGRARVARQAELGNSADGFPRGLGAGKLGGDIHAGERG